MNIPKKYVGRTVEIQWMDPNQARGPLRDILKGRAALATWREYGVLWDVTDGVVMIAHSIAQEPGAAEPDEIDRTAVPEVLIEKFAVLKPDTGESP